MMPLFHGKKKVPRRDQIADAERQLAEAQDALAEAQSRRSKVDSVAGYLQWRRDHNGFGEDFTITQTPRGSTPHAL